MANISWGKPRIFVQNVDVLSAPWIELATPIEDSTELSAEKGDKLEAKIEGGENEDVKYKRSTYTLVFNIRKAKGRTIPFPELDGVVSDHFAVMVQPEDPSLEGFYIESATVSIDDTFTAADGNVWNITMEAVKAASGDTVKFGVITVNNGTPTFVEGTSIENPVFEAVTGSTTGKNPMTEGWYERTGTSPNFSYRPTWDTTPTSGKTYYKVVDPNA